MEITLQDFNPKETYIYLEEYYKKELLNKAIIKSGSQRILAEKLNRDMNDLDLKQNNISNWIKRKNLRLDSYYLLCEYCDEPIVENKIKGIKGRSTTKIILKPKLNIELTKELANILAKFYCDGSINPKNSGTSKYNNKCRKLIKEFKNNIKLIFGDVPSKEYKNEVNVYSILIPHFIGVLLNKKFNLNLNRVPKQIYLADKEIKSHYLRAVFDDEGSINKVHGQIRLKMKYKCFVVDIKRILENDFKINCSNIKPEEGRYGITYYFVISGQYNLKKFYDNIGFSHPKKLNVLKNRLKTYKFNTYGYKSKDIIFRLIKENGPKTTKDIAKLLNRNKRTINFHLNNLKKQNKVRFIRLKKSFHMNIYGV